jgi:3-oxoacyl-[acyl-carrier protein] reductase
MTLEDRTAVVTGAAQGLGEAIARHLSRQGASVMVADLDEEGAGSIAAELDPSGARAVGAALDVRSLEQVERVVDEAIDRFGSLDILVNNAARTVVRSMWEIDEAEWDDVLAVNLRGVYYGCRAAGERMRRQGSGRIVNLSSAAGQHGRAVTGLHYAASKAGILTVTRFFATELAPSGVTVNAVAPGPVEGPSTAMAPPDRLEAAKKAIPVGRLANPREVAALVAFLCSPEAAFITGATYDVNGGMLMR